MAYKEELLQFQTHAYMHYAYNLTGNVMYECKGKIDPIKSVEFMACPLCRKRKHISDFNIDHAPQKSGKSSFGEPSCAIYTCIKCNYNAGKTFEYETSFVEEELSIPNCLHSRSTCRVRSGVWTVKDEIRDKVSLADLKSAYLIAFLVLGYEWGFHNNLIPIRSAIRGGDISNVDKHVFSICTHEKQKRVFEITSPYNGVAVTGSNGFSLILPHPQSKSNIIDLVTSSRKSINALFNQAIEYEWPQIFTNGKYRRSNRTEQHHDAKNLFHIHRCVNRSFHTNDWIEKLTRRDPCLY